MTQVQAIAVLVERLRDHLKIVHQQAIDADKALDQLQAQKQGQFTAILKKDQGFQCQANRFQPYVEEVAQELLELQTRLAQAEDVKAPLGVTAKKLESLMKTMALFHQSLKPTSPKTQH